MPAKPKPTRMSDVLPSSSTSTAAHTSAPATTAPSSSEGSALPILSASQNGGAKKRKRPATTPSTAPAAGEKATASAARGGEKTAARRNHEALYAPWELLPARERKTVEEKGTGGVETVVWTRNQNVKAGVNRLTSLLGAAPAEGTEGKVLAVSAQAEGTVKLVGIVDVALRVVGEGKGRGGAEALRSKWFVYTVLSSVLVPRGRKDAGVGSGSGDGRDEEKEDDDDDDAMDIDGEGEAVETGGAVEDVRQSAQEMKKVPVLTVWMSRRRMAGWKEVFGEREVVACVGEE